MMATLTRLMSSSVSTLRDIAHAEAACLFSQEMNTVSDNVKSAIDADAVLRAAALKTDFAAPSLVYLFATKQAAHVSTFLKRLGQLDADTLIVLENCIRNNNTVGWSTLASSVRGSTDTALIEFCCQLLKSNSAAPVAAAVEVVKALSDLAPTLPDQLLLRVAQAVASCGCHEWVLTFLKQLPSLLAPVTRKIARDSLG